MDSIISNSYASLENRHIIPDFNVFQAERLIQDVSVNIGAVYRSQAVCVTEEMDAVAAATLTAGHFFYGVSYSPLLSLRYSHV
jgi:hypothetical protein